MNKFIKNYLCLSLTLISLTILSPREISAVEIGSGFSFNQEIVPKVPESIIIFTHWKAHNYNTGMNALIDALKATDFAIEGVVKEYTNHRVSVLYRNGDLKDGDRYLYFHSNEVKSCSGPIVASLYQFEEIDLGGGNLRINGKKLKDFKIKKGLNCYSLMKKYLVPQIIEELKK